MERIFQLLEELKSLHEELKSLHEEEVSILQHSNEFYECRCNLLQKVQKHMRDPERTLVCDILANGTLLPDPNGERYGFDPHEVLKKKDN